jgi:hypothetical protein
MQQQGEQAAKNNKTTVQTEKGAPLGASLIKRKINGFYVAFAAGAGRYTTSSKH